MTIYIKLPQYSFVFERWETVNYRESIIDDIDNRGIYVFFDDVGQVLYVGKSRSVYTRIRTHISKSPFANEIKRVGIMAVDELIHLDIYETHAINVLKPLHNRDKVYRLNPERKRELEFALLLTSDDIEMYRDQIDELLQEEECKLRDIDLAISREGLSDSVRKYNRIICILDDN